jgi:hypothetical protein
MTVTHPLADDDRGGRPPAAVTGPDGRDYAVADDGTIECPADVAAALRDAWADRYEGWSPTDTCEAVKDDGEVCGRERPCRYHD